MKEIKKGPLYFFLLHRSLISTHSPPFFSGSPFPNIPLLRILRGRISGFGRHFPASLWKLQ